MGLRRLWRKSFPVATAGTIKRDSTGERCGCRVGVCRWRYWWNSQWSVGLLAADLLDGMPQYLQYALLFLDGGIQFFIDRGFQLVSPAEQLSLHLLPLTASRAAGAAAIVVRDVFFLGVLALTVCEPPTDQRHSAPDVISYLSVLCQVCRSLGRDAVELLRPFGTRPCVASLLEIGQRGIDHARAGRVHAARVLLYRLDDFIAVARFFAQQ